MNSLTDAHLNEGRSDCPIIGQSLQMRSVQEQIVKVASTDVTVLVRGESGTGKELIAKAIHLASQRREQRLITINCGAIAEGLVESELFGHERGAFTGALTRRVGKFEAANGGTLFLDEIGEMPHDTQVKLLRALQEKEFERVGSHTPIKTDVRVVAATNRNLELAVEKGSFRADLFFRLNVFPIEAPPLRDRMSDLPHLVQYILQRVSVEMGRDFDSVSDEAMDNFMNYHWPGNVRELENVLRRSAITSSSPTIKAPKLPCAPEVDRPRERPLEPLTTLEEAERQHIQRALAITNWAISGHGGAAELLAINPNTLRSRMKKLNIYRSNNCTNLNEKQRVPAPECNSFA